MTDPAYYWAVVGRIRFDDEDTIFITDLPTTQSEACEQFHKHMREGDPAGYTEHGLLILALLRSCDLIEHI